MKNITVTVDDELYRKARVRAAEEGTTVSSVVRHLLQTFIQDGTSEEKRNRALASLYEAADRTFQVGTEPLVEPGWRDRMYEERFDQSVLGRSLAARGK